MCGIPIVAPRSESTRIYYHNSCLSTLLNHSKMDKKINPEALEKLAVILDEALDKAYGYGRSMRVRDDMSFGAMACRETTWKVVQKILEGGATQITVEECAEAAHEGWAKAARETWDSKKYGKPKVIPQENTPNGTFARGNFVSEDGWRAYTRRLALADTPYGELLEEEKEKDRTAARALMEHAEFILAFRADASKT